MTRWPALFVVALLGSLMLLVAACGSDDSAPELESGDAAVPADYEYVIPAGTGEQIDAGVEVEILPGRIDAKVGEVIRIINEDDRGQLVGPFFVGAHETVTQRFASPGSFVGACYVHPSGQLILEVTE